MQISLQWSDVHGRSGMEITRGAEPRLHRCPRSETRLLQRGHVDLSLLKDPNLYPRFNFALPKENKENFPLRGKLLLKPQHKLHCRSELSLQHALLPSSFAQVVFQADSSPVPSRKESFPATARKKVNISLLALLPGPFPTTVMVGPMLQRLL